MGRVAWVVLTILDLGLAAATSGLWYLTHFLFDAPGSESNPWVWAMAVAMWAFAPICALGAVLPWVFRKHQGASRLFLMPALGVMIGLLCVMGLNAACGGSFSCS